MGAAPREISNVLATWAELDDARSLHPIDRRVVQSTESARSLVLDLFAQRGGGSVLHERDLFNACARLGGLLADGGASPSLAAGAIANATAALGQAGISFDASRIPPAQASLIEGYVAGVRDEGRSALLRSWEYPSCAVSLDHGAMAVACGYPTDDPEGLAAWAERIANHLMKAKIRQVVLSGSGLATNAVACAVGLVGIEVRSPLTARAEPQAGARRWLRLPWRT